MKPTDFNMEMPDCAAIIWIGSKPNRMAMAVAEYSTLRNWFRVAVVVFNTLL
jgi:hypothetical protein